MHDFFLEHHRKLSEFISRSLPSGPARTPVDSSTIESLFDGLALELFSWQFEHVETYRRFCTMRESTPDRVHTWRDIPALTVTAFKEFAVTSISAGERTTVFYSSGTTTSSPSRHFHHPESLSIYEASLVPWFQRHLIPEAAAEQPALSHLTFLMLTPPPVSAPNSSLVHMIGTVASTFAPNRASFVGNVDRNGWVVDARRASEILRKAESESCPVILLGTALSFVQLLDVLARENRRFNLPQGSRIMETGGYKGRLRELSKPELHRLVQHYLGVQAANIVSEYGMSELSSQAYDKIIELDAGSERNANAIASSNVGPIHRVFQFPPWVRVQIVSPENDREVEPGEAGMLRIFDLANAASVMALQTEDLGVARGAGFDLLGRAINADARGCSLVVVGANP